jgi:uncharacterized protein
VNSAEDIIERLGLEPHPEEGGYFRETYRSVSEYTPGGSYRGTRPVGTAIYYLLTDATCSAMHRLPGDEIFHFYLGDPVETLELLPGGAARITILGQDLATMRPQHVVPGGTWQGSRLLPGGRWALLGATMAPGFSYEDYEHGTADLKRGYPAHAQKISERLSQSSGGR